MWLRAYRRIQADTHSGECVHGDAWGTRRACDAWAALRTRSQAVQLCSSSPSLAWHDWSCSRAGSRSCGMRMGAFSDAFLPARSHSSSPTSAGGGTRCAYDGMAWLQLGRQDAHAAACGVQTRVCALSLLHSRQQNVARDLQPTSARHETALAWPTEVQATRAREDELRQCTRQDSSAWHSADRRQRQ
jgi:hypothetical protein